MISFIIIGYNEGWKLEKSVLSVIEAVKFAQITDYEIIYVDSNSNDGSLESILKIDGVQIYKITGVANAAIARNIGANNAKGEWLFFIDGDMEIDKEFCRKYLDAEIKHTYFTGQLVNFKYDEHWNFIKKDFHYTPSTTAKTVSSTGGIFIIHSRLWNQVNGMKNKYKRSQDLDFSLRLAARGNKILRVPDEICIHHTIPHDNQKRMWKNLKSGNLFYQNSVLLRDHLFNPFFIKSYLRKNYATVMLLISVLLTIFVHPLAIFLYLGVIVLRSIQNTRNSNQSAVPYFFSRLAYHFSKDLLSIGAFFLFFPKNHQMVYDKIK